MNTTLVIGASEKTDRYSNKAIQSLLVHHHNVVAIGAKAGEVNGVFFDKNLLAFKNVDTVTLYINATIQQQYYDYIISLQPRRVIFNPGTENEDFVEILHQHDIITLEACTLVLLSIGSY